MQDGKENAADNDLRRAELTAVLSSPLFQRAPALAQLLQYLCNKALDGEGDQIKEYSVGVDVFRRGVDFDHESDSIVRVQANRLRKRLAEYYETEGREHPLRISIPVGQYCPRFDLLPLAPAVAAPAPAPSSVAPAAALPAPVAASAEPAAEPVSAPAPAGRRAMRWLLAGSLSVIVLLIAAVAILGYVAAHRSSKVDSPVEEAGDQARFGPPAGDEVRILAGGPRSVVDHSGKLWLADAYYSGGQPQTAPGGRVTRTLEPNFFQHWREGDFRYDVPLKPGRYELRLHFAERACNGYGGAEGARLMRVVANGRPLLDNFDVALDAGCDAADVKTFPGLEPSADGQLHLAFASLRGRAMVSALEILPAVGQRMRPVRLLTRLTPYYSNDSRWWAPDNYFQGGQLAIYSSPTPGVDEPEMYESERWGNFNYAIPVAAGKKYAVTLYFAVHPGAVNGEKVFNVFCNGRALLQNFDPTAEARGGGVIVRRFKDLEANSQDRLQLEFIPVRGSATLSGLEVIAE